MNLKFFNLCFLAPLCFLTSINEKQNTFIKAENQQYENTIDSIIRVPILEIQDSAFYSILEKIATYKDLKKQKNQGNVQLYALVKIKYYNSDISIESIPNIPNFLNKPSSFPLGVITMRGYDFFYFDPYEILPYYVKTTSYYKTYEYKPNKYFEIIEYDVWSFTIKNEEIELNNFYPMEEIDKELFLEIYNK
jgi:hypothetical protein